MTHKLPFPWRRVATVPVGGLTAVGFSQNSQYLLVESHSGLGLFDLLSGQRVARSQTEVVDEGLTRTGIGPVQGETVQVAGLWGGQLDLRTSDGWSARDLPPDGVEVVSPTGERQVLSDEVSEFRVAGFSQDGAVFVFATAADLTIFIRMGKSKAHCA